MRRLLNWLRHSDERTIGQYWDEVVTRSPATPVPLGEMPTDLTTTIRQIHSLDEQQGRHAPFADRQLQMLLARHREMNMSASAHNLTANPLGSTPPAGRLLRPRAAAVPVPAREHGAGWWMPTGALRRVPIALVAVLLVVAALLAVWYTGRPDDEGPNPAIVAPEAVTPRTSPSASEVGPETELFTATFAEADLPTGDVETIFYRLTIEPGETMTRLAGPYCGCPGESLLSGVGAEMVESGRYHLRSDAPMRVRRAGSAVEEDVPAGTATTLGPGDSVVHLDYAAAGEFRSAGTDEVVVIGVAIVEGESAVGTPVPPLPEGARPEQLSRAIARDWESLAPGPVTVSLRRMQLAPGETWPAEEPGGLETIHIESGQIDFAIIPAGAEEPASLPLRYGEGRTTLFSALGAGVRRSIENTGDVPATLLVLTIEPGSGERATPEGS